MVPPGDYAAFNNGLIKRAEDIVLATLICCDLRCCAIALVKLLPASQTRYALDAADQRGSSSMKVMENDSGDDAERSASPKWNCATSLEMNCRSLSMC